MNIAEIADPLESAPRRELGVDEPERDTLVGDTLWRRMARDLRLAAAERFETEEFGRQLQ